MVQPFCSVYAKSYRSFDREPELEVSRSCAYFKDLGENFLPLEDSKTIYNPERDETVIKEMHLKRLISTYQASYCLSEGKRSMVIDPDNLEEDQFMVHFNKYYAPRTGPVPRPLDTARRIFGYSRFSYYYTERSTLEDEIYREAYDYFKRDYDKGKSRLFAKKQREMHEARRKAKGEVEEEEEEAKAAAAGEVVKEAKETIAKKNVEEVKPEVRKEGEEETQNQSSKGRICQVCREKFGDVCNPPQNCEK